MFRLQALERISDEEELCDEDTIVMFFHGPDGKIVKIEMTIEDFRELRAVTAGFIT